MEGNSGHHFAGEGVGALHRVSRRLDIATHLDNAIDADRFGPIKHSANTRTPRATLGKNVEVAVGIHGGNGERQRIWRQLYF